MIFNVLLGVLILLAIGLIGSILLQSKGAGVGSVFGGETAVYRSRRGVEKILHYATIVSATLLGLVSLTLVLIKK